MSDSYIRRMRRKGNLVLTDAGMVDVNASDELLDGLTHPVRGGKRPGSGRPPSGGEAGAGDGVAELGSGPETCQDDESVSGHGIDSKAGPVVITVQEAVRRERLARARLAELELGEQAGQLMRVDQVNRVVFTLVRQAINRMQGMSGRLAKTVAVERDAFVVGAMIDAEVQSICEEMRAATTSLLDAQDAHRPAQSGGPNDAGDGEVAAG